MIDARRIADLKLGAQKRSAQFGDQFLEGIGLVAKALALLAVEPVRSAAPAAELVQPRRFIGLCRAPSTHEEQEVERGGFKCS